jgi:hypothetical protein
VDQDQGNPLIQGNIIGPGCSHNCLDWKRSSTMLVKNNFINCSGTVTINGQSYPACNGNPYYAANANESPIATIGTFAQNIAYGAAPGYTCFGANGQSSPPPISLNFYNNTCTFPSGSVQVAFNIGSCAGGTLKLYNNIFAFGYIAIPGDCVTSWDYNDKYQTTGNAPSGAHDQNVNPLFVDPNAMNFHLQSGSPVVNSGNSSILNVPYMGACGTSGTCP